MSHFDPVARRRTFAIISPAWARQRSPKSSCCFAARTSSPLWLLLANDRQISALEHAHFDAAQLLGRFRKAPVEAHEGVAGLRFRQMKGIGEIHPPSCPVERLRGER